MCDRAHVSVETLSVVTENPTSGFYAKGEFFGSHNCEVEASI